MKKNKLTALAFGVMLLAFGACGTTENKETPADAATNEQVAAVDYDHAYICPMHCENSASMEPGQCPVCGMDLVKNPDYKGAATETAADTTKMEGAMQDDHHDDHSHEGHSH